MMLNALLYAGGSDTKSGTHYHTRSGSDYIVDKTGAFRRVVMFNKKNAVLQPRLTRRDKKAQKRARHVTNKESL